MMKIMLNTNVYCRPFDDHADKKVKEEADSAFTIFTYAYEGRIETITSDVLYEEVDLIKDKSKRESVYYLVQTVEKARMSSSDDVIRIADDLNELINDYNDCLQIAFAAISKCNYFITCDNELIESKDKIERFLLTKNINTKIKNPLEYIREVM